MEAEVIEEIKKIRKDIDTLTKLYIKLINRIIPEEEAENEDIEAIESDDEILGEEELFKSINE